MLVEGNYRPGGEQFAEGSAQEQGAVDAVNELVERPGVNLGDINQYVQMWLDMRVEKHGQIPETEYRRIVNVGLGIRYLAYDQLREMKKALLLVELAQKRTYDKVDRLVFSYEDAQLLQMAAAAVNIVYDPGEPEETPENIEKRTFKFADVEQKAPDVKLPAYMTKDLDISHWSNKQDSGTLVVDAEQ